MGGAMNVSLGPQQAQFVKGQVESGRFRSADEVVAEALDLLKTETDLELDDETAAAINRAEEQIDRGEGIDFKQFAEQWRQKLSR